MQTAMPKRVDANQPEIVKALCSVGCSVLDLSAVGKGAPDILVSFQDKLYLMEIKNPATGGKLNKRQQAWHRDWNGKVAVVYNERDALSVISGHWCGRSMLEEENQDAHPIS